jgi:RES domain-containing protein
MSRVGYRHCDPRYPFLWATSNQPAARWHRYGEGPAHYFADTPVGAWAEFLRHEEIRDVADLKGVRRSLWAAELPETDYAVPALSHEQLTGGRDTHASCQAEATRLRRAGMLRLQAPSAALIDGGARGWIANPDEKAAPKARDGVVWVLYGIAPNLVAWPAVEASAPAERLLPLVRHF